MKKLTKDYSRDIRSCLGLKDYDPAELQKERILLGLTQKDVAKAIGVTATAISCIETGKAANPWAIQMYGIILERYKAYIEDYIPTYRKEGTTIQNEICGPMAVVKDF